MSPALPSPPEADDSPRVGAIVVAAGASLRMAGAGGKPLDKVFAPLLGKPLIAHTLSALQECPCVGEIVLVLSTSNLERGRALVDGGEWSKLSSVCPGGARRQDSVRAGLRRLSPWAWIAVHDGARPCVTRDVVQRGLERALATGAAIPVLPVNDTIKRVHPDGIVTETVQREGLGTVQTPQVFRSDLLRRAYEGNIDGVTDDASLVERLGHGVGVFPGSVENIKITTPEDLVLAEAILRNRAIP